MRFPSCPSLAWPCVLALAGCASAPTVAPPEVPEDLRPPAGETAFLAADAQGFQVYECATQPDQTQAWVFRAPEAYLLNDAGETIGKHYAGPTWESVDQSKVVGEVKAHAASPQEGAIPWLRLAAKATSGPGILAGTKTVLRVGTSGGVAPAQPCRPDTLGTTVKVPYQATYYFYR